MISVYLLLDCMVIFVIYISTFCSFISSAEGKRRSSTQAKRTQHDLKGQKFLEAARPERAEALSPGHRPGYNSNQQGAL